MKAIFVAGFLVSLCYSMPADMAEVFGLKPHELNNICDLGPCINNMCPAAKGVQYWCCPYNWECCRTIPMISDAAPGTCMDRRNFMSAESDCAAKKHLCNDPNYVEMMRVECPKSCGFC
ncbi:unnamed protein product, partial [Mesorhabditis belari]|uniref:ShKT domain-containing protein n=1 Tax=Mesorhabditis belari TaxID=2138241 RepID=A0AAF3EQM1_9BILA